MLSRDQNFRVSKRGGVTDHTRVHTQTLEWHEINKANH